MDHQMYSVYPALCAFKPTAIGQVQRVMREYLRCGAHPYFLWEVACWEAGKRSARSQALEAMLPSAEEWWGSVPPALEQGFSLGVSRLYDERGEPRIGLDPGILQGAIAETFSNFTLPITRGDLGFHPAWESDYTRVGKRFLQHPQADVVLAMNIAEGTLLLDAITFSYKHKQSTAGDGQGLSVLSDLFLHEKTGFGDRRFDELRGNIVSFLSHRIDSQGIEAVGKELIDIWYDGSHLTFWSFVLAYFGAIEACGSHAGLTPYVRFLNTLIAGSVDSDQRLRSNARRILGMYPIANFTDHGRDKTYTDVRFAWGKLIEGLKKEFSDLTARHVLFRLLRVCPFYVRVITLLELFLYLKDLPRLDERTVEWGSMLGDTGWRALCDFQGPSLWTLVRQPNGGNPLYSLRAGTAQMKEVERAVRDARFERHNPELGEAWDNAVFSFYPGADTVEGVWNDTLTALSGDVALPTTHLQDSWMRVDVRTGTCWIKGIDYVEIARHRMFGERNAACRFQVFLTGIATPLMGKLDPEGEMVVENAFLGVAPAYSVLKGVILESLVWLLFPRNIQEIRRRSGTSQKHVAYYNGGGSQPRVNLMGGGFRLSRKVDGHVAIHPAFAERIFRWLLGDDSDIAYRLLRYVEEGGDLRGKRVFRTFSEAMEGLIARECTLSSVYVRVMRAHSHPLGAVEGPDGDVVVMGKMSRRAQNLYAVYRADGGRELDFSPVSKTFLATDGRRIPFVAPRTFHCGIFRSLTDAFDALADSELKERVQNSFVL
jgi:hypothetical protein